MAGERREVDYSKLRQLPADGNVSLTEAVTYILDGDCLTTKQYLEKQEALWGDAGQPDVLLGQLQSYQSGSKIDALAALTAVLEEVLLLDPENTRRKTDDPEASKTKLVAAMVKAACAELTPWDEDFSKLETYQEKHWPWLGSKITQVIERRYHETMEAAARRNMRLKKYLSDRILTIEEAIIKATAATKKFDLWNDNFSTLKQILWRMCQSETVVLTGIEAVPVEGPRKQIEKLYFDDPLNFEFRCFPALPDELGPDPVLESTRQPAKRSRYRDVRIGVEDAHRLKKAFKADRRAQNEGGPQAGKKRPIDNKRDIELRRRINAVIDEARPRDGKHSYRRMAALICQSGGGKFEDFSESAVVKIISDRYDVMERLGIKANISAKDRTAKK